MLTFLILVWSLGVIGIGAWLYAEGHRENKTQNTNEKTRADPQQVFSMGSAIGKNGEHENISMNLYIERPFEDVIKSAEESLSIQVDYRGCAALTHAIVRPGAINGIDTREFIEGIQIRLKDSNIHYVVQKLTPKRYLISCK